MARTSLLRSQLAALEPKKSTEASSSISKNKSKKQKRKKKKANKQLSTSTSTTKTDPKEAALGYFKATLTSSASQRAQEAMRRALEIK